MSSIIDKAQELHDRAEQIDNLQQTLLAARQELDKLYVDLIGIIDGKPAQKPNSEVVVQQ